MNFYCTLHHLLLISSYIILFLEEMHFSPVSIIHGLNIHVWVPYGFIKIKKTVSMQKSNDLKTFRTTLNGKCIVYFTNKF